MAARLKGFLPLAVVIGVLAFLCVEFALNFSFHWVSTNILVTLTIGVVLGLASAKIAAAITPKEKTTEARTGEPTTA